MDDKLFECVTGTGGRRRAQNFDCHIRQRRINVGPFRRFSLPLRQRLEQLFAGQLEGWRIECVGDDDSVIADHGFDDFSHTIILAGLKFAGLHAARCVGDVWSFRAYAGTEQLDTATGAGRFNDGRLEICRLAELLGNCGREREHRG